MKMEKCDGLLEPCDREAKWKVINKSRRLCLWLCDECKKEYIVGIALDTTAHDELEIFGRKGSHVVVIPQINAKIQRMLHV